LTSNAQPTPFPKWIVNISFLIRHDRTKVRRLPAAWASAQTTRAS